jgi:hypothetical protein
MTKITDAEVEAAWGMLGERCAATPVDSPDFQKVRRIVKVSKADLRAALEAAEAVRVKAESNLQKVQIPSSTLPDSHDRANAVDDQRWLFSQFQAACATLRERSSCRRGPFLVDESDLPIASSGTQSEQPTIPEGFIPWQAGECPVAEGTVVSVRLRGRVTFREVKARHVGWDGSGKEPWGIIAYRIHKPADFRLEAGKYYVDATGKRTRLVRGKTAPMPRLFHDGGARAWKADGTAQTAGDPDLLALSSNQENSHDR